MNTLVAFAAAAVLFATSPTVAKAADGAASVTQSPSTPIDTTKGLTPPNKSATVKTKPRTSSKVHATKKKVSSKATATPTARCNDGAQYFSKERRGACAAHGGVKSWYVW